MPGSTAKPAPSATDPHATNSAPFQLRNPLASTNFFSWSTSLAAATNQASAS